MLFLPLWVIGKAFSESIEVDRIIEGLARGDSTLAVFRLTP
jgi:hypothetical protein